MRSRYDLPEVQELRCDLVYPEFAACRVIHEIVSTGCQVFTGLQEKLDTGRCEVYTRGAKRTFKNLRPCIHFCQDCGAVDVRVCHGGDVL